MNQSTVERAGAATRRARDILVSRAAEQIRQVVRAIGEDYLKDVRALFERAAGRLDYESARKAGVLDQLRERTAALGRDLAAVIRQGSLGVRRSALANGMAAGRVVLEEMGRQPPPLGALLGAHLQRGSVGRHRVSIESMHRESGDPLEPDEIEAIPEPPEVEPAGRRRVARIIIATDDAQVWLFQRSDENLTMFPGGGLNDAETYQVAAVREAMEETGLLVELTAYLSDFCDEFSVRRYYVGTAIGGTPATKDRDGNVPVRVFAATVEEARSLLTSPFDRAGLDLAGKHIS